MVAVCATGALMAILVGGSPIPLGQCPAKAALAPHVASLPPAFFGPARDATLLPAPPVAPPVASSLAYARTLSAPQTGGAQGGAATAAVAFYFPEQIAGATRRMLCESGGRPEIVSPNGLYFGLWQFDLPTWRSVGGVGFPSSASADEQTMRARMLYDQRGWQPWGCK